MIDGAGPRIDDDTLMGTTLRRLETTDEYHACEEIQRQAWDFSDNLDVIPLTQLLTAQMNGGLVLGAFGDDGTLQGFVYGFLGRDPTGRLVHCSHMLAVREDARGRGLGALLKWGQRQAALDDGIDVVVWTFDPLESLNACFNFGKLGVVSDTYLVNLYGETTSRLHAGTATDRLKVKWFVRSGRVVARAAAEPGAVAERLAGGDLEAPWVLRARPGSPESPGSPRLDLRAPRLRCQIPGDVQALKRLDAAAAVAWRQATRAVFTAYIEGGYFVRECVRTRSEEPCSVYLLERGDPEPAGLED